MTPHAYTPHRDHRERLAALIAPPFARRGWLARVRAAIGEAMARK